MKITVRRMRRLSAGLSGLVAALYLLIGVGVLDVVTTYYRDEDAQVMFTAAAGFAVLAVLLAAWRSRVIFLLGIAMNALAIVGYFSIAETRTPQFELWGILVKATQLLLTGTLVYLVFASGRQEEEDEPAALASGK